MPRASSSVLLQKNIQQEADQKIAQMAKELEAAKKDFAARIKQFAEVTEGLEKKAQDASKGEKKKGAAEMADLVRKHNAKYNEMLQQRMAEEDAARSDMEKQHTAEIAELKKTLGPRLEAALSAQQELQRQQAPLRRSVQQQQQVPPRQGRRRRRARRGASSRQHPPGRQQWWPRIRRSLP